MGQVEDKGYTIKEDGTIVRGPKLEEFKKRLKGEKKDEKDERKQASNDNNGCISTLIGCVVFVLITTIIGGVIGFFVNEHDSVELGLLLGGLFGLGIMLCSIIEDLFD